MEDGKKSLGNGVGKEIKKSIMKSMSINSNNDNAISKTSTTITWLIYVLCKNKEEHQEDADLA